MYVLFKLGFMNQDVNVDNYCIYCSSLNPMVNSVCFIKIEPISYQMSKWNLWPSYWPQACQ